MVHVVVALLLLAALVAGADLRAVDLRDLASPKVAAIQLEHLDQKPIANRELRAALQTQQGKRFQRRFYRGDLSTIENLYRSLGYLDVDIVRRQFFLDDAGELHIHLKIDSGQQWRLSRVVFEMVDSTLTATDLEPALRLVPGEVFRFGEVLRSERELVAHLNGDGFAQARVRNRVDFDARRQQAAVVFRVATGRRMYFGPIVVVDPEQLHTRPSRIRRELTIREGERYDPEAVRATRNNLARTSLFRSVTLETPAPAAGDSVQSVRVRLQERRYLHVGARAFANNTEPGVSANVQHANFLGRGNRIGADGSLGQPLQGLTLFLTERNLLGSILDLTVSAGVTEEWGQTRVFADPADSAQFALLTANHSIANELDLLFGYEEAAAFISGLVYQYPSVERLWQGNAVLGRRWLREGGAAYQANLTANWTRARTRPISGRTISLDGDEAPSGAPVDTAGSDDGGFGDDPFGSPRPAQDPGASPFPYDDPLRPGIPIDATWSHLLANGARAVHLKLDLQRDTRDNQIAPTRGSFARAAGRFAYEFGGVASRVLDAEAEARHYLQLGGGLVWAQAVSAALTGSLRRDRDLPQAYWKELGGEGSVRGVERASILAIGGGRALLNLRNELRLHGERFGAVLFWDRGGVWRRGGQASWDSMVDGYGSGLRWDPGIPLRFDVGWSRAFARRAYYLSVGQAF